MKVQTPGRAVALLGILLLAASALACSAAPVPAPSAKATDPARAGAAPAASARNSAPSSTGEQAAPAALSAPAAPAALAGKPAAAAADAAASALPWDRMVIRTAKLVLEVKDVEAALQQVRQVAQAGGGYVSASNSRFERSGDEDRMVADVTIQVRNEEMDHALQALRGLAVRVETETSTSQDVTEEFVDLDASLRNLRATEAAILKLIDRAQRIEDVLALQRELTSVRGQIERIVGRQRFLERRTELATISITLHLPASTTESTTTARGWDPLAVAHRGWEASLLVLRGVAEVVIVVAAFSWWLVPLVAAAGYVWAVRRRRVQSPQP